MFSFTMLINDKNKSINLNFFAGPFQITVILVLLYQQMQLAIIPGVALLLLMIPINLFLQRIQKTLTVCICMSGIDLIFLILIGV